MIRRMVFHRLLHCVVTLFLVSILLFSGTEFLPGDTAEAILAMEATPENLAALRKRLGLDRSAPVRYFEWLGNMLTGDFGMSLAAATKTERVVNNRVRNSALLGMVVALIAIPIAVSLGLLAAMVPGSIFDRVVTMTALGFASVPEFFIATVLVLILAVHLRWLPAISYYPAGETLHHIWILMLLPVLTLCITVIPQIARMTRASVLNVLSSPYVEMAILKGLTYPRIVWRHALPNSIGPIINIVALNLAYLLSGAFIVETIFSYPGLAKLMVDSVRFRDAPLALFCGSVICAAYIVLILVADIASIMSNPRLRHPK